MSDLFGRLTAGTLMLFPLAWALMLTLGAAGVSVAYGTVLIALALANIAVVGVVLLLVAIVVGFIALATEES